MVRRAERALGEQALLRDGARDGVDARGLQRLLEGHVRQDGGHAAGHQRFAAARRADHQHVVASGGGDLQRTLGLGLALDVAEVLRVLAAADQGLVGDGLNGGDGQFSGEVAHRGAQGVDREDLQPLDAADLVGVRGGKQDLPHAVLPGGDDHGQRAAHRAHGAIQRELAEDHHALQGLLPERAHAGEDPEGEGEVVGGALLLQIGRGQVHRQALRREGKAAVFQRRAHALPGFLHRGVRQPHDFEHRHPVGQVDLHVHREALDAGQAAAVDECEHGYTSER